MKKYDLIIIDDGAHLSDELTRKSAVSRIQKNFE